MISTPLSTPLVVVVVSCLCLFIDVEALSCNCYNGRPISSSSCECACSAGYLAPTCSFGLMDQVEVILYINDTADNVVFELLVDAVASTAKTPAVFVSAKNVSKFSSTSLVVTLPGYGVQRLLTSISYRDPWVNQYKIVSAYVITPATSTTSSSFFNVDYVVYTNGNITISVMGIAFIASAIVLCVLLVALDSMMTHNTDEFVVSEMGGVPKKKRSKRDKGDTLTPQPSGGSPADSRRSGKYQK